jgi:hypothetical protein
MINFTYKHITQNNELEVFTVEGLNNLITDLKDKQSINVDFYRVFDQKDRLKEVAELRAEINDKTYIIRGLGSTFKTAVKALFKNLKKEMEITFKENPLLQSA